MIILNHVILLLLEQIVDIVIFRIDIISKVLCKLRVCTDAEIKLPTLLKKRGRPKGSDLTTIGLPRNKKRAEEGPQPYAKLSTTAKSKC